MSGSNTQCFSWPLDIRAFESFFYFTIKVADQNLRLANKLRLDPSSQNEIKAKGWQIQNSRRMPGPCYIWRHLERYLWNFRAGSFLVSGSSRALILFS